VRGTRTCPHPTRRSRAVRSCDRLAQTFGLCPGHLQMARDRFSPNGFDRVSRRADRMLAEAQARAGSRS